MVLGGGIPLGAVEAVVAGGKVGHRNGEQVVGCAVETKQVQADEKGRDRAVCHPAEGSTDAASGKKAPAAGGKESPCQVPEAGSHKQGGDDLTALVACCQGEGGEQDLDEKVIPGEGPPKIASAMTEAPVPL